MNGSVLALSVLLVLMLAVNSREAIRRSLERVPVVRRSRKSSQ